MAFQVGDTVEHLATFDVGTIVDVNPSSLNGRPIYKVDFGFCIRFCFDDEIAHLTSAFKTFRAGQQHTPPPTPQPLFKAPPIHVNSHINLPHGYAVDTSKITWESPGAYGSYSGYVTDDERKKRKEAGQCEECGALLPISIWGLGECPSHPKTTPVKQ